MKTTALKLKTFVLAASIALATPLVGMAQDITTLGRIPANPGAIVLPDVFNSKGKVKTDRTDRFNWFELQVHFRENWYIARFDDGDMCGSTMRVRRQGNRISMQFRSSECDSGASFTADRVECELKLADDRTIVAFGRVRPRDPILLCVYHDRAAKRSEHFMMTQTGT